MSESDESGNVLKCAFQGCVHKYWVHMRTMESTKDLCQKGGWIEAEGEYLCPVHAGLYREGELYKMPEVKGTRDQVAELISDAEFKNFGGNTGVGELAEAMKLINANAFYPSFDKSTSEYESEIRLLSTTKENKPMFEDSPEGTTHCIETYGLPRYKRNEFIWAGKILSMTPSSEGTYILLRETIEFDETIEVHPKYGILMDLEYLLSERPDCDGYFVVYPDGRKSYLPSKEFENGYSLDVDEPVDPKSTGLSFGEALDVMKRGGRVQCPLWKDELFIEIGETDSDGTTTEPATYIKSVSGGYHRHWSATSEQMLAEDWEIVT